MRPVLIYDCEVETLVHFRNFLKKPEVTLSYLRCNGCGAQTSALKKHGQLHDCPTRGAWQLVREGTNGR